MKANIVKYRMMFAVPLSGHELKWKLSDWEDMVITSALGVARSVCVPS